MAISFVEKLAYINKYAKKDDELIKIVKYGRSIDKIQDDEKKQKVKKLVNNAFEKIKEINTKTSKSKGSEGANQKIDDEIEKFKKSIGRTKWLTATRYMTNNGLMKTTIEKDASLSALPKGKRISRKTGKPYWENRANRSDVRQPSKTYPKLAKGGQAGEKIYDEKYGVGKSKYVVNFHDGEKKHKDGSPFFDIAIFKNKVEKDKFVKDLESKGYSKRTYAKGGKVSSNYEIELFWKGLSGDNRNIGKYVVSENTLDKIEEEFETSISIDVIDDSSANPIPYDTLIKEISEKGRSKFGYAKGGVVSDTIYYIGLPETTSVDKNGRKSANWKYIVIEEDGTKRESIAKIKFSGDAKDVKANTDNAEYVTQREFDKLYSQMKFAKGGEVSEYESKFEVDDVVYNKKTKTIGIVRMEDDKHGEVKTDADGNVDVDDLEHYNPLKYAHQGKADVAPSTKKEIEERMLWKPFASKKYGHGGMTSNLKYEVLITDKNGNKEQPIYFDTLEEVKDFVLKDNDFKKLTVVDGGNSNSGATFTQENKRTYWLDYALQKMLNNRILNDAIKQKYGNQTNIPMVGGYADDNREYSYKSKDDPNLPFDDEYYAKGGQVGNSGYKKIGEVDESDYANMSEQQKSKLYRVNITVDLKDAKGFRSGYERTISIVEANDEKEALQIGKMLFKQEHPNTPLIGRKSYIVSNLTLLLNDHLIQAITEAGGDINQTFYKRAKDMSVPQIEIDKFVAEVKKGAYDEIIKSSQYTYNLRYAHGGTIAEGNYHMIRSQAKEVKHHVNELQNILKNQKDIDAWVVAKMENASSTLSDITHYLDGKTEEK